LQIDESDKRFSRLVQEFIVKPFSPAIEERRAISPGV
jgi:hypothetical protein